MAAQGDTWSVFQEPAWQRTWWECYGRGELVIASVHADNRPVLLAPLFIDGGMAFLVGSGGSDYLDFIGDVGIPGALESIVAALMRHAPGLLGVRLYHVPQSSRTARRLERVAEWLDLALVDEGSLEAPALDLGPGGKAGLQAARKKSLVRHENALRRSGDMQIRHYRRAADVLPRLDAFFDQHVRRWRETGYPSLFVDRVHRDFYRRLVRAADQEEWLRFSVVEWQGEAIACHFGFSHRGRFLWYKPTFESELSARSPGEVLLRNLLLAAVEEGADVFDFGLGNEIFKRRFADRIPRVTTWGLYPNH
ncbi:GNAT family N-acetyltransferase [Piscinibacter sakaiensis]|uniref:GNAT family N-acetyltransferase n=1 Tax=Piscinibacter sakaiensis TaxID=1547922 RepID=UPI003AAD03A7